ncbi:phospholipase D-like domain-containing protein [Xylophilus sp. GW821-FHT01B05]
MLLYHSPAERRSASPFDSTILEVAHGNAIKVVSPYIGLSYLERVLESSSGWKLISDVDAWLSALNHKERVRTEEFIHEHLGKVRHLSGVHAKTVIGPKMAYVGSANLTKIGVLSRTELGVRITEDAALKELHAWFDALWHVASDIPRERVSELIAWMRPGGEFAPVGHSITLLKPISHKHAPFAQLSSAPEVTPPLSRPSPEDLDLALLAAFDALAEHGFTLAQLKNHLSDHLPLALKTLYLQLILHCAAIPRTVFSREAVNRLVCFGGVFMQSTPLRLYQALRPFDDYLAAIVRSLSFETPRSLPQPDQLERLTGIPIGSQAVLVHSLVQEQLLLGDKGIFVLNDDWEWSPKFKLLAKSYTAWQEAERSLRTSFRTGALPTAGFTLPPLAPSSTSAKSVAASSPVAPILASRSTMSPLAAPADEFDLALDGALRDPTSLALRIDHVYASLCEMIEAPQATKKLPDFDALVRYVVRLSGEESWLVRKVLKGEIPGFPKLLKFKFGSGKTPCRIYLCNDLMDDELYPRTIALLKLRDEPRAIGRNQDKNTSFSDELTADDVFLALLQLIDEFGEALPYTHLTGLYRRLATSLNTRTSVITKLLREHEGSAPVTIDRLSRKQRPSNRLIATVYELTEEQKHSLPQAANFLSTMRGAVLPHPQLAPSPHDSATSK